MKFEETYLNDNILDALYDMHFEEMTPIQEKCIPEILDGYDVLGVAQTGTGKTAAYLLPILSMLDDGLGEEQSSTPHPCYPDDAINCVIMAPTRELAQQIDQAMQGFSYYLPEVNSISTSRAHRSSCSTKPTACSTWDSRKTSCRLTRCCQRTARR